MELHNQVDRLVEQVTDLDGARNTAVSDQKELVEETFKRVDKYCTVMLKDQKIEMTQRQLRTLKLVLCHDYT